MMLEYNFTCPLLSGMHARPASALEDAARSHHATISVLNKRTHRCADAKSVLALVGADFRYGDDCVLRVEGDDAEASFEAMKVFLDTTFPSCDEPLPDPELAMHELHLPPSLRAADAVYLSGTKVVGGIGEGCVVLMDSMRLPAGLADAIPDDAEVECVRVEDALSQLALQIERQLESGGAQTERGVLKAHLSIMRDPELRRSIMARITDVPASAATAICGTVSHFDKVLHATGSAVLQERILDIEDVCSRLLVLLYGDAARPKAVNLAAPSVCVAEALTPSQFLALDRRQLKGLVLRHAGTTSHTVILAQSFGVPTLTGVEGVHVKVAEGRQVVVDGNLGILVTDLTPRVKRYYDQERSRASGRRERLKPFTSRHAMTADGVRVEVAANISVPDEVAPAFASGAEGVGLFRTEMLFMEREEEPTEEEQLSAYRQVLDAAAGSRVIVRTLDVGGDKPLPYLKLEGESTPFSDARGVQLYPCMRAMFKAQLRALVRASSHGALQVMLPMVSRVEEVRWVRDLLAEVRVELSDAGVPYDPDMPLGIMVELPAAAAAMDKLAEEVDFFSIGTNDLTCHVLGVDRWNDRGTGSASSLHPQVIRVLKEIADAAQRTGKWLGVCGEMAGDVRCLPLLVGLGVNELSMVGSRILETKAALASLDTAACGRLASRVLTCTSVAEVDNELGAFHREVCDAPLIVEDLIVLDRPCETKESAIKELVDNLYVTGRAEDHLQIEDAIWQREAVYSTGLGFGFAIPHFKSGSLLANSLSVLRLAAPVAWGSSDGEPVTMVLMLAMRDSESGESDHMKIFSQLARKLMHEEFRAFFASAGTREEVVHFLMRELDTM